MNTKTGFKDQELPDLLIDDYFTIKELCKKFPRFKQSTVRHYIRHKEHYHFHDCHIKFFNTILIHKTRFIEWANNHIQKV